MKAFAEVHYHNLHQAMLLKVVSPFSEEFQCGIVAEIYLLWIQLTTTSIAW